MSSHRPSSKLLEDKTFSKLKEYIIQATGLAYYRAKQDALAENIEKRLLNHGFATCEAYLNLLLLDKVGDIELDELITSLTIGETYFLRYAEQFNALRDVILPEVIKRKKNDRRLRIWSAGCSIGAEAYSISILLQRNFAQLLQGWEVSILGTDINREFLARAQEGRFDAWAFRSVPKDFQRSNFEQVGPKSWLILPQFRARVSFQYHNLVSTPFPSLLNNIFAFDIILCRNVMIYFGQDLIEKLVGQFYSCLVDDGWFLVGYSEPNLEFYDQFERHSVPGATLYKKSSLANGTASIPLFNSVASRGQHPEFVPVSQAWSPPQLPEILLPDPAPLVDVFAPPKNESDLESIKDMANRGELEKALVYCERLLETEKLNPILYFYHSLILEQLGLAEESEKALRRAIYLNRQFILAHYHLGLLLQKSGKVNEAIRYFKNAFEFLSRRDPKGIIPDSDDCLVVHLLNLTKMHLEVLDKRKRLELKA